MRAAKKNRITTIKSPAAVRGLSVLFILCVLIKIAATAADGALTDSLAVRLSGDYMVQTLLSFELGSLDNSGMTSFAEMFVNPETLDDAEADSGIENEQDVHHSSKTDVPNQDEGTLYYRETPEFEEETEPTDESKVLESPGVSTDIVIDNTTDYEIDIDALLNKPLNIKLKEGEPAVLIIHTHTSEAYTQSGSDTYVQSDPFRTEDKTRNIARVGMELATEFEKRGISVVHDTRSYDFPSYTGAYNRTYTSIQSYLKQYPTIKLVIDLHRDAIAAPDGSQYKTIAQIGSDSCSQVMFVVGSDAAGLDHPTWRENLTLALHMQREMNTLYPSLARPIRISQYRYNQQLTRGSMLVEIGCAGNTLAESLSAARYFADAASNVILDLYD